MINYKIVAGFAGFAFIVVLIVGIVSLLGFWVLVGRLFLGTLLFGLLGAGVSVLISRYIPELLESPATGSAVDQSEATENESDREEIDIILPEENPHALNNRQKGIESDQEGDEDEKDEDEKDEDEHILKTGKTPSFPSMGEMEDFTEVVENKADQGDEADDLDGAEDVKEDDEVTPHGKSAQADRTHAEKSVSDKYNEKVDSFSTADVDTLPSIENLDDFSSLYGKNEGYQEGKDENRVEIMGQEQDPKIAAQAIKTWLNKDKEG